MASYAGANHKHIPGAEPASAPAQRLRRLRQLSPFPPAPKSVRVVSVFSEPPPSPTPDSTASPKPKASHSVPWQLWLVAFTVFLGLAVLVLARSQGWNQLGI